MKKRCFERGSTVFAQGERIDHLYIIKHGCVRISHKGIRNDAKRNGPKQPISVEIANLGARDVIGLIECMDESLKKSPREAVSSTAVELFFVP